uniref:Uncharacterized protein n=1 Tax=Babesia bovis TaxID=5865 RepID=S6B374_BABBO|nr:hypothetical protein [Babesia bovis]
MHRHIYSNIPAKHSKDKHTNVASLLSMSSAFNIINARSIVVFDLFFYVMGRRIRDIYLK